MKEKETKKIKNKIIISIIVLILLSVIAFVLYLYLKKPIYKVIIKDGGGVITREAIIEKNKVKKLPKVTPPEGK